MSRPAIWSFVALGLLGTANLVWLDVRSVGRPMLPEPAPEPLVPSNRLALDASLAQFKVDFLVAGDKEFVPFETPNASARTLTLPDHDFVKLILVRGRDGKTSVEIFRRWYLLESLEKINRAPANTRTIVATQHDTPKADEEKVTRLLKEAGFTDIPILQDLSHREPPPALYVDSQLIGELPLGQPIYLQEGAYCLGAFWQVPFDRDFPMAPFVFAKRQVAAKPGSSENIKFTVDLPGRINLESHTELYMGFNSYPKDKSPQEKKSDVDQALRRMGELRGKVEQWIEEARFDPLLQQMSSYYDAFLRSPPRRPQILIRGVPVLEPETGGIVSKDLELRGPDIHALGKWLVMRHNLDRVDALVVNLAADEWQQIMQGIGDQERARQVWSMGGKLASLNAEAKQLRIYLQRTAVNLNELLDSASRSH